MYSLRQRPEPSQGYSWILSKISPSDLQIGGLAVSPQLRRMFRYASPEPLDANRGTSSCSRPP